MNRFLNIDPLKGFVTSVFSFCIGISPEVSGAEKAVRSMSDAQDTTIFIVQLVAFAVTIIAGTLTAINGWHKLCDKRRSRNENK